MGVADYPACSPDLNPIEHLPQEGFAPKVP